MNEDITQSDFNVAFPELSTPVTHFAPAERDTVCEIRRKTEIIGQVPLLSKALDAMPAMVMILNRNRQIISANQRLLNILNASVTEVVEKRPGEAIRCVRAGEGPGGCGTGKHCSTCGAVQAVLASMETNTEAVRECGFWYRPQWKSFLSTFG